MPTAVKVLDMAGHQNYKPSCYSTRRSWRIAGVFTNTAWSHLCGTYDESQRSIIIGNKHWQIRNIKNSFSLVSFLQK